MSSERITYSVVVPVYRSGAWLPELVARLRAVLDSFDEPFEIILVNDRSPDEVTWPTIEHLSQEFPFVRGVDLLYNVGQFRATICGLEEARGDYVITMDDDLQHPPEEIPKLVEAIRVRLKVDCVMGEFGVKRHSWMRNAGSSLVRSIMRHLYDKPAGVTTSSFRIMTADVAKALVMYRIARPQLGPLVVRVTRNLANVEVDHHARTHGRSNYQFHRLVSETLTSIVNASIAPLRLISLVGFLSAAVALSVTLLFFVRWLTGGIGVAGFTSLILAITFFSGMILLGIGVLGEYLGRVIEELTGMPRYSVRTTTMFRS